MVNECFLGSQMQLDAHMTSTVAALPEIPAVCVTVSASRRGFIPALRQLLLLEAPFLRFASSTVLLIFWNQVVNCWCLSCGLFLCICMYVFFCFVLFFNSSLRFFEQIPYTWTDLVNVPGAFLCFLYHMNIKTIIFWCVFRHTMD